MEQLELSVATDTNRPAYGAIAAQSFGFPIEETPHWFERAGHANLRVLRDGARVIGGAIVVPMGQWFGGRAVAMHGLAGVAVAPEARGAGAATAMLRGLLRELREAQVPLSTLYPANVPLYRDSGWERAGARHEIELAPSHCRTDERALPVTRVTSEEDAEVRAVYERVAATKNGVLARGPYVWGRIFRPRKGTVDAFKVHGDDGRCEGYVVVSHRMHANGEQTEVYVPDVAALTKRAAERILRLLSDYGSVATTLRWVSGAPDLLTFCLPDRRHRIRTTDYWMLRVVDVARALASRGFPAIDTTLELEIEDDVLPENRGRYRLRVEGGRPEIERGGDGTLRMDVRGLAALYSGYLSARTLAACGLVEGDASALARAETLFAGPAPAMGDFF